MHLRRKQLGVVYAFLVASLSLGLVPIAGHAAERVLRQPGSVSVTSGLLQLNRDLTRGTWSASWPNSGGSSLSAAACAVRLKGGSGELISSSYPIHRCAPGDVSRIADAFGTGVQITVHHLSPGKPELRERFRCYSGLPCFLTSVNVVGQAPIASNFVAPIVCSGHPAGAGGVKVGGNVTLQTLSVPYDNDSFVRYDSSGRRVSYEVTALYDNQSRHGLVIGSVTHDLWKTGINMSAASHGSVGSLSVYGGIADTQTRDTQPHGMVAGRVIPSPEIFVGYFPDWRRGLETYGQANARIHPPLTWTGGVPFGWNSWAAYESHINAADYNAASDFLKTSLAPRGFSNHGTVTVNFDSFWDNLSVAQIKAAVKHVHANGQKAGIYWTPFVDWFGKPDAPVQGTSGRYHYGDIYLKDAAGKQLRKWDGGIALDPTHPGTLTRIDWQLARFVRWGFDFVKLDFMTHGAMEGAHFDPKITTGTAAYNVGMRRIDADLSPKRIHRPFFISLSIAPIFPAGYAHSRRISCDTWGQLANSEYMLNSLTYGWWQEGALYPYNDPDHTVLTETTPTTEDEARTRLNASVIAGTMVIDSDPFTEPPARQRAEALLTNPEINALARRGFAFEPVEGDTADHAADAFVYHDRKSRATYVALFNLSAATPKTAQVALSRIGLNHTASYKAHDLWTHADIVAAGSLSVPLRPAESTILRLTPSGKGQ